MLSSDATSRGEHEPMDTARLQIPDVATLNAVFIENSVSTDTYASKNARGSSVPYSDVCSFTVSSGSLTGASDISSTTSCGVRSREA